MASKLKVQELALQSPNGLVEKTLTVGNDGVVTIDSINPMEKTLFKEYVVTGSAVTRIDITGLDINTHKSYRIECEFINATSTNNVYISVYVNNDTTATNYYAQSMSRNETSSGGGRGNNSIFIGYNANQVSSSSSIVNLVNNKFMFRSNTISPSGSGVIVFDEAVSGTQNYSNITQLTFISNVSSSIGIGSKIRIYRGDL